MKNKTILEKANFISSRIEVIFTTTLLAGILIVGTLQVIMRYVYKINNYPGATDPVYATLLVYKNQIIGGDVTNSAPKGTVSGFAMPKTPDTTLPSTTGPAGQE